MNILISTNMYEIGELKKVFGYLKRYEKQVGVEVFPLFHLKEYEEELMSCLQALSQVPISFHGPYYSAEHSAPSGSALYNTTMEYVKQTLEYCKKLNSRYLVYHHNNCKVVEDQKTEMIRNACNNFREIENMYAEAGVPVVVENAGVMDRGNMLLNQNEFIDLCKKENYKVLIDIGHAHANGWDLTCVMKTLKDQIIAYHVHNNDGTHDDHQRIHNGTLDFEKFVYAYKQYTPNADIVMEYAMNVSEDVEGIQSDLEYLLEAFKETNGRNVK